MGKASPPTGKGIKKASKLAAAALAALLLCSCDFIAADTESLLHPPTLSREQEAVYAALEATENISDIVFQYPAGGDHRSPFVLFDMDGDGLKEAIIFYSLSNDLTSTRVKVLQEDQSGNWSLLTDFPLATDRIDFVQFSSLLTPDSYCMIIGWVGQVGQIVWEESKYLNIYSLSDRHFTPEIVGHPYVDYLIQDFDGNGLEAMVTVGRSPDPDRYQQFSLSLLGSVNRQRLAVTSTAYLSGEAESLEQMVAGPLWNGRMAVYVDERRRDGTMATEIIRVDTRGMAILAGGIQPTDPDEESGPWDLYQSTFRTGDLLSRDYNGDTMIEIPQPGAVSDNPFEEIQNTVAVTELLQLQAEGLATVQKAVINTDEGYLFLMPQQWLDWVYVLEEDEAGEWRFYLVDPETNDPTFELLRIQSTGIEASATDLIDLGSKGTRRFYGYLPRRTEDVPTITEEQLGELFRILP